MQVALAIELVDQAEWGALNKYHLTAVMSICAAASPPRLREAVQYLKIFAQQPNVDRVPYVALLHACSRLEQVPVEAVGEVVALMAEAGFEVCDRCEAAVHRCDRRTRGRHRLADKLAACPGAPRRQEPADDSPGFFEIDHLGFGRAEAGGDS